MNLISNFVMWKDPDYTIEVCTKTTGKEGSEGKRGKSDQS